MKAGTERREKKKMDGKKDFQKKDRNQKDFENGKPGKKKAEVINKGKGGRSGAQKEETKGNKGAGVKREDWKNNNTKAGKDGNRREDRQGTATGKWGIGKTGASGNKENRKPGTTLGNKQFRSNGDTNKNIRRNQFVEKKQDDKKKVNGMEVCPVSKKCGGCQYQGIPYQEQLKLKEKEIRKWIGKFCKVTAVIGMENPYHYRNKVHAVFDRDKRGNPICGVYQSGTHNVVPIESCMIEDQKADEIIQSIRGLLKSFKIRTYDEDTGYGLLRHVLVKRGFTTNEIMVVLVTASPVFPSKNNFVGAIRKLHPEITTIIQNVNARGTSMVLGDKEKTLFGKGYIEDVLCGCTFRISSKSFYQVNPVQTEVLYKKAIDAAGLTGNELVIDAYCGIGTIGLIASKKAKRVIGVELNKDAVRDAVTNAKRNDIENVRFFCADAGDFMANMAAQGEKADVVFMDPPRSGSTEQFMDSMVQMGPERVVYVSCNPETLGRDLEYLTKKGYGCKGSWGVDMFAWTGHVETVVLLVRKSQ